MAEHNRKSLVDDSFSSVGVKKAKASSGGGGGNTMKIALVVGCLVIAGVLLAFNFGLIDNPFAEKIKPTVRTAEEQKQVEQYEQQQKQPPKVPTTIGGS